jgi:AraC-like DNA-binding protein
MIQNLIVLITGLIGFVTAGLILKNYKLNSSMNIYIILIIITISIRYFLLGLVYFTLDESFKSFCTRYSNFALVIIPLFYLYFENLSNSNKAIEKKEFLHFIFPISFFIFILNLDFFKINNEETMYILSAIFFLYIVYYTFLCYKLLKRHIWLKNETIKVVKKQSVLNSKWAYFLFLAIVFIVVRLLGSLFFELNFGKSIKGSSFLWISAIIWLMVLFKIIVSPEILYGYDVLHKKIDENRNGNLVLNSIWNINPKIQINNVQHLQLKEKIDANILTYIEEIEKISLTDKIFRDPTTTMADLANKLNAPKSHITYLFKYHSTISFSEYKKAIRIQDAIKLIKEDFLKENTLDYLSKKVGFPSYNTFFTSFKEVLGASPLEYCKTDRR